MFCHSLARSPSLALSPIGFNHIRTHISHKHHHLAVAIVVAVVVRSLYGSFVLLFSPVDFARLSVRQGLTSFASLSLVRLFASGFAIC